MLQAKYQVSVEFFKLSPDATLRFTFARPIEDSVFAKMVAELESYNFKVHYYKAYGSDQIDCRVVDVNFNINLYNVKEVLTYTVELLKSEGFTSFLYLKRYGCEQSQSTDLNDII
jgi:hypothetical protein